MERRQFITLSSISLAAALAGGTATAAQATSAPGVRGRDIWDPLPPTMMTDNDLDHLLRELEALPEHLKTANPRTTPGYERKLSKALNGLKVGHSPSSQPGLFQPQVNWGSCAWEVAQVIVSYGIPVAKVISWIKRARSLYGGVRGIRNALRYGQVGYDIGGEAVGILEMILGVDGVIGACFS